MKTAGIRVVHTMNGSRREQEVHAIFVDQMECVAERDTKPILDVMAP